MARKSALREEDFLFFFIFFLIGLPFYALDKIARIRASPTKQSLQGETKISRVVCVLAF